MTIIEFMKDAWIQEMIDTLSDISSDKVYVINNSNPIDLLEEIKKYNNRISKCNKIILRNKVEAPFFGIWIEVVRHLNNMGFSKKDILIIDIGDVTNVESLPWIHHSKVYCDWTVPNETEITTDKSKIFLSLARVPRTNRVFFTLEMIKRGLLLEDECIVSCGSAKEYDSSFFEYVGNIIPKEFRIHFPLTPYGTVDRSDAGKHSNVEKIFSECLINVVQETGMNHGILLKTKDLNELSAHYLSSDYIVVNHLGWDRRTLTEKTLKCFAYKQIPIFLSSPGYVKYVKSLGFDVFEDIINHSYDTEYDPVLRTLMVADELERMVNLIKTVGVVEYQKNILNFNERVNYNFNLICELREKSSQMEFEAIKKFLIS